MSEGQHEKRRAVALVLPMEWRDRVRTFADASELVHPTDDIDTRILDLRERLKAAALGKPHRRVKTVQVSRRTFSR